MPLFLYPLLSFLWSAATSRAGIMLFAAGAAYSYGHHRATVDCEQRIAAQHARAIQAVIDDQKHQIQSRQKLDWWDSIRVNDRGKTAVETQNEIDNLKSQLAEKGKTDAKASDCPGVDPHAFGRRVQRLDRSGGR